MTPFSFPITDGAPSVVTETKFFKLMVLPGPRKKNIKVAWMSCPRVWPVSGNKASISSENVSPLGMRTQTTS